VSEYRRLLSAKTADADTSASGVKRPATSPRRVVTRFVFDTLDFGNILIGLQASSGYTR
jgi:hypothetical protein